MTTTLNKMLVWLGAWITRLLSWNQPNREVPHDLQEEPESEDRSPAQLPPSVDLEATPWMAHADSAKGTREIRGKKHNPTVVKYFSEVRQSGVKDDETPWCAAFVGACLERTGIVSTRELLARGYLKWGRKLATPRYGCIVVLRRGNSSWQGHVGFYVGENASHVFLLGGNQSNEVNVSRYPKSKILGYRWPTVAENSRTFQAARLGFVGLSMDAFSQISPLVIQQTAESAIPLGTQLLNLGEHFWLLGVLGKILVTMAIATSAFARWDDLYHKGR